MAQRSAYLRLETGYYLDTKQEVDESYFQEDFSWESQPRVEDNEHLDDLRLAAVLVIKKSFLQLHIDTIARIIKTTYPRLEFKRNILIKQLDATPGIRSPDKSVFLATSRFRQNQDGPEEIRLQSLYGIRSEHSDIEPNIEILPGDGLADAIDSEAESENRTEWDEYDLQTYLEEIRKIRLINWSDERDLARNIEAGSHLEGLKSELADLLQHRPRPDPWQ